MVKRSNNRVEDPDRTVVDRWSGAAPFWEKHRDIATGPGEPALSVATLVGPDGKVIGIDPIPEMVAAARRAAENGGFTNTQIDGSGMSFPSQVLIVSGTKSDRHS
jgi:SAM-dependent methyltransferase